MDVDTFWRSFLEEAGLDADTQYLECFHFDLNERSANELLALVLAGKKRATASSQLAFAAEGCEMLTADTPKTIADIEAIMSK